MRLYYTGVSTENLRKARARAPSHSHGAGWTPAKMTESMDVHYFVDSGGYTGFDREAWIEALEQAKTMPRSPDFIVWPDVYGDADATMALCRGLFDRDAPLIARRTDWDRYVVFQPGASVDSLFAWAREMGADGVFLGGPQRWKRAVGGEVVRRAGELGWPVHVGNPGGSDGLVWAYRTGFDSLDTTTVFQNGYFHYLDRLEAATEETGETPARPAETAAEQATLGGWSA